MERVSHRLITSLKRLFYDINYQSALIAKEVAEEIMAKDHTRQCFVAGAMGPTNRTASLSPDVNNPAYRAVTYDELKQAYYEQAKALHDGGVDLFLPETTFDTLNLKAAISGLEQLFEETGVRLPVVLSLLSQMPPVGPFQGRLSKPLVFRSSCQTSCSRYQLCFGCRGDASLRGSSFRGR